MRGILIILFAGLFLISCDEGLSPELADEKSGFGGTISFVGNWNPDITLTHLVVFNDPLLSIADFNVFNLSFVSDTISNGSQSYKYTTYDENALINTIGAGTYSYIAVAQCLKDTITLNREDWIVAGIYYQDENDTIPGSLTLREGEYLENINISCDFNNLPPQPPGGLELINSESDILKNEVKEPESDH